MKKDVKRALVGEGDYHALMRSIAVSSMRRKAGYIPPKMDAPRPEKNLIHWQNKKYNISMGVEWVFYAVECGHFSPSQAKMIWRYGQAIKIAEDTKHHKEYLYTDLSPIFTWFVTQVKNQSDYYFKTDQNTKVWDNEKFKIAYKNLSVPFAIDVDKDLIQDFIVNMYGGLFIYIHYGNTNGLDLFHDNFRKILDTLP